MSTDKRNNLNINGAMNNKAISQELDVLPDIACEEEDIICSMKDEAEFSRNWINDCLLRRYIKKTGDKHLNVRTRKLIKLKSYNTYININKKLHKDLQKQVKLLLSKLNEQ